MTSDDRSASPDAGDLARARDHFAAHGRLPEGTHVRDAIVRSWHRSRLHGLDPASIVPAPPAEVSADSALLHAARAAVADRSSWLTDLPHALVVTDGEGRVMERWADDASILAALDELGVSRGLSQSESVIGTSSAGIALETGQDALVSGAEHYRAAAAGMASAGSPIRHPATHRVIGTVNVYSQVEHASPLMLALVHEVARSVENALLDRHAEREHALIDTYLESIDGSSEPIICLNEHSIVGNATAAARLESLDQTVLWELASQTISTDGPSLTWVPLADGTDTVAVTCEPIRRDGRTVGAALRLVPSAQPADRPAHAARRLFPDLVGASTPWLRLCERIEASLVRRRPMSLIGEPGVGKSTIIAALTRAGTTYRLEGHRTSGESEWLRQVDDALGSDADFVVMENLHLVPRSTLLATMRAVRTRWSTRGPQILVTWTRSVSAASHPRADESGEWAGDHHEVPALRSRLGDLALLLDSMSREHGESEDPIEWSPEAVQALSRVPWSANLRSLSMFVERIVRESASGVVGLEHLPADIRASATRRELRGLERLEAQAIAKALATTGGNKKRAADMLGISRSTLYRKIEMLGLDLNYTTY